MRQKSKKSRWKKIILWSSVSLVVVLIGAVFAMDFAVNKVLRSMGDMDMILEEIESVEPVEDSEDRESTTNSEVKEVDIPIDGDDPQGTTTVTPAPTPIAVDSDAPDEPSRETEASTSPSKTAVPEATSKPTYKAEISTDKAKEIEESASVKDKATVANLMMKNLSASDIKVLSSLASGGLSLEEKKKARDLILKKLSEKEYNQLIAIAQKFGVSQGKKYSEVIKEE